MDTTTPMHTLAPWEVDKQAPNRLNYGRTGRAFAFIHWQGFVKSEAATRELEANMRLIAAAPDLLAMVERMIQQCGGNPDVFKDARALVATINGREG